MTQLLVAFLYSETTSEIILPLEIMGMTTFLEKNFIEDCILDIYNFAPFVLTIVICEMHVALENTIPFHISYI